MRRSSAFYWDPYSLRDSLSIFAVCDIGNEVAESGSDLYLQKNIGSNAESDRSDARNAVRLLGGWEGGIMPNVCTLYVVW